MTPEILQVGSDIEALERLVPLKGRHIIDVGCGDGALAFALAKRGASVLGIEADPHRAQANRALGAFQRVTLVEGFAQNLPRNDGTVDCVIFANFLSRIEAYDMDDCLREARRVLNDNDGIHYVVEQETSGSYDDMVRMFHDESAERAWALDALKRMSEILFSSVREVHYGLKRQFSDFDAFIARFMAAKKSPYGIEDVNNSDVRAVFEQGRKGDGYEFEQAMRVNLYCTGKAPSASA